jgi:hypothetical protein
MRRFLVAATALLLAAPAAAQQVFTPELDERIERGIPPAGEVEEMGDRMGHVLGALLDVPVGPLIDAVRAADPERRDRRDGRGPRTLRDMAGRDDPHFEARLQDDIRGVSAGMAQAMEQIAVLAPVLRRSLGQVERDMAAAFERGRQGRYEDPRDDDGPRRDDERRYESDDRDVYHDEDGPDRR